MKSQQALFFSMAITLHGSEFNIKALKCTYGGNEVLYKVALPTAISSTPICWISGNGTKWKVVMGINLDKTLTDTLFKAIGNYEKTPAICPELPVSDLRSA